MAGAVAIVLHTECLESSRTRDADQPSSTPLTPVSALACSETAARAANFRLCDFSGVSPGILIGNIASIEADLGFRENAGLSDYRLARVKQRSIGSLFFSVFGGLWLFVALIAFGLLTRLIGLLLFCLMLAFVAAAVWILRAMPKELRPEPQRERDGKMFGWVNAAQGVAIFSGFSFANRLHHPDLAFPFAVLVVGLHMFALPRSYRIPSNLITGGILVAAAVSCFLLLRGDTMVGAVTMCAGLTLWCSAAWKLRTAFVLFRASDPNAL